MDRLRVATLQYFIRPIRSYEEFQDQVGSLVQTAADYKCGLVVFPEYYTIQLLTLGDTRRPIREQIHALAEQAPRVKETISDLARRSGVYVVGGTVPVIEDDGMIRNISYVASPAGKVEEQGKLHMTRFEREDWGVAPYSGLRVFETSFGRMAVAICYDVEFPELARAAARSGARILVVPSCTDDRQGFLRVRYCAHARAVENQMYVIHSSTVGSLPAVPAVHLNYGQAAIITPSDFQFARDGILAEGNVNQEMMVIGDLNLRSIRESASETTVSPLTDSEHTDDVLRNIRMIDL